MGEGVTLGPEDPAIVEFRIDAPMLATLVEEAKVEAERAAEALGSMPNA
jgi:hypothetical protein